ncbi:GH25 family lysozyme [Pseudarthrobacter phenanthrenivorans]|nr:GH25 family lysozyme [Pseudarthrobacter phenanthrenivorans]
MKRNLSQSRRPALKSLGTALLAAALVAGPGLAGIAFATEPAPAPATPSPAGAATAMPAEPTAVPTSPASPTETVPPAPTPQPSPDAAQSMAEAVGVGGAEMGQRSARVTSSAPSDSFKRLSTESLSTEGTWMPTFGIQGLDVSGHQPSVDWQQQWNMGARFAYVKATEGNYYKNPSFNSQYQGSRNLGMIRGAYHFAIPNWSSGADQARYFVQNGGGWSADGYTMPPVLDFEFNPYEGRTINGFYFGNTCYNMSPAQLQSWVRDFGNTVLSMTGRLPVIYTNTSWWNQCLGNPAGFGDYPLWIAAYPSSPTNNAGPVPTASWGTYSIWQYSSTGPFAGDSNVWNGSYDDLRLFATNGVPRAATQAISAAASAAPSLGAATSAIVCGQPGGGCYQDYQGGAIIWSPTTGAHPTSGDVRAAWARTGFLTGPLGYPTSDVVCGQPGGGCYQDYQGGAIIWSPTTGAHPTSGDVRAAWARTGFLTGPLGYPTSDVVCGQPGGGCYQDYQGGAIIWSPTTGAHPTSGPTRTAWGKTGFVTGPMGYPTSDVVCGLPQSGCYQDYQGGAIIWSPTTGAHPTSGPTRTAWGKTGFITGPMGYPTGDLTCGLPQSGCYQDYQGGAIIWSPTTGAHPTSGPTRTAWGKTGFITGPMGYPTGDLTCGLPQSGCYQDYQGGAIIWSPTTGAHPTSGPTRTAWGKTGFITGPMGYPTGDLTCGLPQSGCYQDYQGGAIIWSPTTGAHPTSGPTRTAWGKTGFITGPMGYPTGDLTCGLPQSGCYQDYQGGAIIWSPTTGAHPTSGPTRTAWGKTGFITGPMGYPTGDLTCGLPQSGCYQDYQGGAIIWSPTTGAHPSTGPIRERWAATNFLDGPLRYPTSDVTCGQPDGGCYQDYQGGAIIWSQVTGAHASTEPIRSAWASTGFLTGPLGYPTEEVVCDPSGEGCRQDYQGGIIRWHPQLGTTVERFAPASTTSG